MQIFDQFTITTENDEELCCAYFSLYLWITNGILLNITEYIEIVNNGP